MSAQPDVELAVVQRVPPPERTPPATLGAAAQRFARLSLRKSEQTKATYESSYRRFAAWLAEHHHGHDVLARARTREQPVAQAPLSAFTVDALAAYLDELEATKAPATVKKERAALNRLAKYLHTLGLIDATEILLIEGSRGASAERTRDALDASTWSRVKSSRALTAQPGAARSHLQGGRRARPRSHPAARRHGTALRGSPHPAGHVDRP